MPPRATTPRPARAAAFLRDRAGAAIVEFALVITILLALVAAAIDLGSISGFNREIERTTTQVAAAIVSCPSSTTPGFASCVTDTMRQYSDRKVNTLIRYPTMSVSIVQVNEVSGALKVCAGTATYLEDDVKARALAVMNDKDVAIVVLMSMTYQPIFPLVTRVFTGATSSTLRGFTVAVQASQQVVC